MTNGLHDVAHGVTVATASRESLAAPVVASMSDPAREKTLRLLRETYRAPIVIQKMGDDVASAWVAVGGLATPSKLPGWSISLPAHHCSVGSILATVRGTVCFNCYALKNSYCWPNVAARMIDRLYRLQDLETWVDSLVLLIDRLVVHTPGGKVRAERDRVFRFHDSGDIQSRAHLEAIAEVARRSPSVRFWIPTKERARVAAYVRDGGVIPDNLIVRLSGTRVDGAAPSVAGLPTSSVTSTGGTDAFLCPAYSRDGKCGDCRACWDASVPEVTYPLH